MLTPRSSSGAARHSSSRAVMAWGGARRSAAAAAYLRLPALPAACPPCLPAASPVDSILDKEAYTLEELLDEDELIQECKSLNARLTAYLRQKETVEKLVGAARPWRHGHATVLLVPRDRACTGMGRPQARRPAAAVPPPCRRRCRRSICRSPPAHASPLSQLPPTHPPTRSPRPPPWAGVLPRGAPPRGCGAPAQLQVPLHGLRDLLLRGGGHLQHPAGE